MKFSFALLLVITMISLASPESDMNSILDALYRADGEIIYRCLSIENQESLSMVMAMVRLAPEQVAEQFRQKLDICISPSEVVNLTSESLISVVIDSPYFREELPYSREMIDCTGHFMQGDTAMVYIAIVNEDSVYQHPMILQEGSWRVATSFFSN